MADDILAEIENENEEVMTAEAVLNILREAWMNERLAPELLPHKAEFVEVMMDQMEQMEENMSQLEPTDLRCLVHRQELERIRYLMRSYLRLRLAKIELHSISLFRSTDILSPEEVKFLKEYTTGTVDALKTLSQEMPGIYSQMNSKQLEIAPDLNKYVFARSKENLAEAVLVGDGVNDVEVIFERGSQHILPYRSIRDQLRASKVIAGNFGARLLLERQFWRMGPYCTYLLNYLDRNSYFFSRISIFMYVPLAIGTLSE